MTKYLDRYPTMHEYAEGKRINPKMTDLISRADAIEAIDDAIDADSPQWAILRTKIGFLPSAELPKGELISRADAIDALCHNCAYNTDAQCKTDSGYWCESGAMIREDIPSAEVVDVNDVTIHYKPYPSAEAEPKWNCTANFVAEQLDRLRNMTDEERWDFFIKFFSPSADTVSRGEYEELYRKAKEVNEMANDILADFPSYKELVSADAVRVVYCKDCKWWSGSVNTSHNNHLCKRALDQNVEYWVRSDDYCSYGEHKGGDTE